MWLSLLDNTLVALWTETGRVQRIGVSFNHCKPVLDAHSLKSCFPTQQCSYSIFIMHKLF